MRQRSIKNQVTVSGVGLQTGNKVNLTLRGAPENSGVTFVRADLPERPRLNLRSADSGTSEAAQRRTLVGFGPLQIQTTEHLLAALSGLSIDNIEIEIDNVELPGLDGSARGFAEALIGAGIEEQKADRISIAPETPLWCKDNGSLLALIPDSQLRISYTLHYPGIGAQFFSVALNEKTFMEEVAPARTFCSELEALELLKRGLGKGANYENTLVMGPTGPINNKLRFPDEPARHKVLDLVGDLYLAGAAIRGHIVAIKSGHRLNMELVKLLKSQYTNSTFQTNSKSQ